MIAVVLAAGKGSRLGGYTTDLPKSLLPLNDKNKTLLGYNLELLKNIGISRTIIVTGFRSEQIESYALQYSNIEIVYNPFWNHCNVLGSLYMALGKLTEDFLFLHADTLADEEIWRMLLAKEGEIVLPFQRKNCVEEEMKILMEDEKIVQISKSIDNDLADGEFLGIAKFSRSTVPYFKSKSEELFKLGDLNHYMESVIQAAIDENRFDIEVLDILDHNFVEVDFEEDYLRAKAEFGN